MYFRSFSAKRRKYVQSVTEAGFQINKLTIGSHTSTGSMYPSALAMHFSKGGKRSRTRALVRIFQAASRTGASTCTTCCLKASSNFLLPQKKKQAWFLTKVSTCNYVCHAICSIWFFS